MIENQLENWSFNLMFSTTSATRSRFAHCTVSSNLNVTNENISNLAS